MRFEERELKSYAEPVLLTELQQGAIYFALTYVSEGMLTPSMETVVFVGRDLKLGDTRKLYFQDAVSYRAGERYNSDSEDGLAQFWTASENSINHIFEFEHALDGLLRCSLKRRNVHQTDLMHLEARELKPDAEPVAATELHEGSIYFALTYLDEDMLIPSITTLVFAGKDLNPGDLGRLYFQDVNSHRAGMRYGQAHEDYPAEFHITAEKEVNHIFEFEHALEELMRCSLRRGKE